MNIGWVLDWLLQWSNVISGLGSLLFSGILAYLYLAMMGTQQERTAIHKDQTTIQENQIELMKKQRELMEIGQKPDIQVDAYGIAEDTNNSSTDQFKIHVSNFGKGYASNLRLQIQPFVDHLDNVQAEETTHFVIKHESLPDNLWNTQDNYILPGESEKEFTSPSSIHLSNIDFALDHPSTFEFATEMLDEEGEDEFRFKLILIYDTPLEEGIEHEFADLVVPIRGRTSFDIAIEHAIPYDSYTQERTPPQVHQWNDIEENTGQTDLIGFDEYTTESEEE